jgi:glycosyltransferase involved in cell wall biosynthesis
MESAFAIETPLRAARPRLTALLITHDEAANIGRALSLLTWVGRVIVLDSGSTDATLQICSDFPNVEVHHRPFDSFAEQCNYGLGLVESPWCLSIDADYSVPPHTARALQMAIERDDHDGFYVPLTYCVAGRPLRRAILPPRMVLFRTRSARYEQDGHAHRVIVRGRIGRLPESILHDDRKSFQRWLRSQERYAERSSPS